MAKKELLAPVGSYDSMVAAVNAGCDAIYTGGRLFGARAFANNFSNEELIDVIKYCHLHSVAVYLTVNTLLSDDEIEEYLFDYLKPLYEAGLDAVIIQDIGVLEYISVNFPDLPIHLSTQFTSTTHLSSEILNNRNITRVVTPRELSLKEIKEYAANTSLEIETFVHGALCYCYSGQCLMSALVGGRSGNRGKCAQPCRKDYFILESKNSKICNKSSAILSLKDLCTLDLIPQLMESNIYSFKIEGRMKKPEYVFGVVSIYRKYMDLYDRLGGKEYNKTIHNSKEYLEDKIKLLDIYNRGEFTLGYMKEHNSKDINCCDLVSHYGTKCGYVTKIFPREFEFKTNIKLNAQDVLQIRDDKQKLIYEFTLKDDIVLGGIYKGRYKSDYKLKPKMYVYRVRNNKLLDDINKNVINNSKKIPVKIEVSMHKNESIQVVMSAYDKKIMVKGEICQNATKAPVSKENVISKLTKLGATAFVCEDINVVVDDNLFVSATGLNDIRRQAVIKLEEAIYQRYYRKYNNNNSTLSHTLHSKADNKKVLVYAIDAKCATKVLDNTREYILAIECVNFTSDQINEIAEVCKSKNKKMCIVLPWIVRYKDFSKLSAIRDIVETHHNTIDYIMVRNYEELRFFKELKDNIKIISDTTMYAYNSFAANKLKLLGADYTSSPLEFYNKSSDVVTVYGNRPVMVSAGCVKKTMDGCDCSNSIIEFKNDKKDEYFAKCICEFCMNMIYTSNESKFHYDVDEILDNGHIIRINFTKEDKTTIKDVIEKVFMAINSDKE